MFNERGLLETLSRQDLLALVAHFELSVTDRRIKNNLVESLLHAKRVTIKDMLAKLSLASLKALCYENDLDDSGRMKDALVQRLLAAIKPAKVPRASKVPKASKAPKVSKKPVARRQKALTEEDLVQKTAETPIVPEVSAVSPVAFPELAQISLVAKPDYGKPMVKPPVAVAKELSPTAAPKAGRKKSKSTKALRPSAQHGAVLGPMHCRACAANFELRKCQVQRCQNWLIVTPTRKICAECMFERNTLSMTEFNVRLEEEISCPYCSASWQHAS